MSSHPSEINRASKYKARYIFIIILFSYLTFSTASLFQGKPKLDEAANHLPVLQGMYDEGFITYVLGDNYKAANTPLPYVIVSVVYKVIKVFKDVPFLVVARICNFIFSLLTVWIFINLYKKLNNDSIDYGVLIFIFYPYFLKTSFTFYMALYGILFFLLAVYLLQSKVKRNLFYSGLAASAGILSQQFIIALPIAFGSERLLRFVKFIKLKGETRNVRSESGEVRGEREDVKCETKDVKRERKNMIKSKSKIKSMRDVVFFIPLIIPAVLFIKWEGLTHPNWRMHTPVIDIPHVTALFVIIGGVLFPYVVQNIQWSKAIIIILILSFVLTFFFMPEWAPKGNVEAVTGYTYHFLEAVKNLSPVFSFVIQFLLCSAGIYVFYKLSKEIGSETEIFVYFTAMILAIIFSFNTVFSERHLLPLIACLFLLTLPRLKTVWINRLWIGWQVIFGSIYFYYLMFVTANF